MDHKIEYERLKGEAEKAFNDWSVSQQPMDWEWFMHCEMAAANYAHEHEEEIWDERGDNCIPVE